LLPAPETFTTKTAADRWLASVIADQAQGKWIDPRAGAVPLRRFAEQWLKGKAALAPKTCELYDYLLSRLILPTLGDVELVELTPARVRAWRAGLLRAGQPGPSTIAKAYRLLSAMMATAVVDNLVTRNPCLEKGAGVERAPEMSIATPEQVGAIAAAVDRRYRALVLTAAYAGCRWGELTGLRCRNLDLAKGTLSVVEQVVELRGGQLLTREPKSASGRRVVHLPAGLIAELEAHVAQFVAPDPDALVFTSGTGGPLRQSNFRNRQWLPALRPRGASAAGPRLAGGGVPVSARPRHSRRPHRRAPRCHLPGERHRTRLIYWRSPGGETARREANASLRRTLRSPPFRS